MSCLLCDYPLVELNVSNHSNFLNHMTSASVSELPVFSIILFDNEQHAVNAQTAYKHITYIFFLFDCLFFLQRDKNRTINLDKGQIYTEIKMQFKGVLQQLSVALP